MGKTYGPDVSCCPDCTGKLVPFGFLPGQNVCQAGCDVRIGVEPVGVVEGVVDLDWLSAGDTWPTGRCWAINLPGGSWLLCSSEATAVHWAAGWGVGEPVKVMYLPGALHHHRALRSHPGGCVTEEFVAADDVKRL